MGAPAGMRRESSTTRPYASEDRISLSELFFIVLEEKKIIDRVLVELSRLRAKEPASDWYLPSAAALTILSCIDEAHMDTRDAVVALALSSSSSEPSYDDSRSDRTHRTITPASTPTPPFEDAPAKEHISVLDEPIDSPPDSIAMPIPPSPSRASSLPASRSRSVMADEEGGGEIAEPTSPRLIPRVPVPALQPDILTPSTPRQHSLDTARSDPHSSLTKPETRLSRCSRSGPPPTPPPNRPLPPVPVPDIVLDPASSDWQRPDDEERRSPSIGGSSAATADHWPFLRHKSSRFSDNSSEDGEHPPSSQTNQHTATSGKEVRWAEIPASRVTISDARRLFPSPSRTTEEDGEGSEDEAPTRADELIGKVRTCLRVIFPRRPRRDKDHHVDDIQHRPAVIVPS